MNKKELKAEARTVVGRRVKKLRKQGILPANIFGKKIKSLSVQVDLKGFMSTFAEVGETGLLSLMVGSDIHPVLVHNVQYDPVSDAPVHVDFLEVNLKEKVEADVPVELVGESPAEKQSVGTVVQHLNEIKVEALPADLPEKFEVDKSTLAEVDQAVYVKDLKVDKSKVKIKTDLEEIVVKVEPPQKVEEVVVAAPAEGEAVPAEGAAAEGEPAATDESAKEESKA